MDFVSTILLLSCPAILWLFISKYRNGQGALPPGPPGLPIIGNLLQIDGVSPHIWLRELSNKYGPLMSIRLGLRPALVVSSASVAREVLKTHDLEFAGRPSFLGQRILSYDQQDIAFATYGPYWREIRKLCVTHLFHAKRIQSFSSIREDEVRRMIKNVQIKSTSPDKIVDLSAVAMSFANRITCRIAFGSKSSLDEASDFQSLLAELQAMFSLLFFSDYIPFMGWVDRLRGLLSRLDKSFRESDAFYERIIKDHVDEKRPRIEVHEDIIDVLLGLIKEKDNSLSINLSYDSIKAVLMNMFVAGSDTTASTIVWTMSALMKHPREMKKVKEEIIQLCGGKDFVTEDDIERLPYLRAIIKETWRMFPPVPLLVPRESMQGCNLNGYEIQPKTLIFVNAWAIGRDAEAWEEPDEFKPERFMGSSVDYKGQHYELIPFGAGRRICPGMHMGTASVELALANLLHAFSWELPPNMEREDIDTAPAPGITVHKKIPLCLVCQPQL